MQLDRELVDLTDDFVALRLVFSQFAANLFRVHECAWICLDRLRNCGELSAFVTGHRKTGGRSIHGQRSFAVLAMKEDVWVGRDFAERCHAHKTSSRYAPAGAEMPNPKSKGNLQRKSKRSAQPFGILDIENFLGIWNLVPGISAGGLRPIGTVGEHSKEHTVPHCLGFGGNERLHFRGYPTHREGFA